MTQYTTLSEELNKLPRERQEVIEARASQIHLEEITLRHLREKLGLSQSELAERLEVQQPAISKLERRQNLELNADTKICDRCQESIKSYNLFLRFFHLNLMIVIL
jgi:DNA-binding transcriptional regulator YiaG